MKRRVLGVPIIILLIVGLLTVGGAVYAATQHVVEIQNRLTVVDPPEQSCAIDVSLNDGSEVSHVLDWGVLENGTRRIVEPEKEFLIRNIDPNWPTSVVVSTNLPDSVGQLKIHWPWSGYNSWHTLEPPYDRESWLGAEASVEVQLKLYLNPDCLAGDYTFTVTFSAEVVQ